MCLLVPGRIIRIEGERATVDYGSETRVGRLIEEGYAVGDYALIQGGFVIAKVDAAEAEASLKAYSQAIAASEHKQES
jgi:hydrogenase assembly chaperone HypC/HupF